MDRGDLSQPPRGVLAWLRRAWRSHELGINAWFAWSSGPPENVLEEDGTTVVTEEDGTTPVTDA